jgi:hypothetical protein
MLPMNIWGGSKSNWTGPILVSDQPKPTNIKLYLLIYGTDEFVDTDE